MREVVQIQSSDDVKNEVLCDRARRANIVRSTEFIVIDNDTELALLSYEDWSERSEGFVYEIFVLPPYRNNGIGSFLLSYAEDLAIKLGCTRICLKPYSLDKDIDNQWLIEWYAKKGYQRNTVETEIMEKNLVAAV